MNESYVVQWHKRGTVNTIIMGLILLEGIKYLIFSFCHSGKKAKIGIDFATQHPILREFSLHFNYASAKFLKHCMLCGGTQHHIVPQFQSYNLI